jgi:hypothetical protein
MRIALAVVSSAAVAGCGSGDISFDATTRNTGAAVKFADCMRTHGVSDFPDPLPSGGFPRRGSQSPASKAAQKSCIHLLKASIGSRRTPSTAELAAALKYARCMRAHGVPNLPDPVTSPPAPSTNVIIVGAIFFAVGSTIDPGAPAFRHADRLCAGLGGPAPRGHPQGG